FLSLAGISSAEASRDLRKLYASLCAGCHGSDLAGGSASSLVDDVWQHGGSDADLVAVIRDGIPDAGMPPFGETVSENELRGLVVLIREQAGRTADRKSTASRPDSASVMRSRHHAFRVETVVAGLREPWSIAFLPDGRT